MSQSFNPTGDVCTVSGASFAGIIRATMAKEFLMGFRHLPNLVGTIIQLGVRILFFFYLSHVASFSTTGPLHELDYFLFVGSSLLLFVFFSTAIWTPLNTVGTDMYNGTLEYLYVCLKSRYAYFSGTVLASSAVNLVFFVPIFVLLSIYAKADSCTMIMILCVCALGITASMAIGVMISLMAMLWKQVQALAAILALLFEFLSGAYAPIHLYPAPVKALAYVLPYTWGYDLVRYYLFKGEYQPLLPVVYEWLLFAGLAAVYTVISLILLKVVEHRVRTRGLGLL